MRERLPGTREGWTHKGEILAHAELCPHCQGVVKAGRTVLFITVNYYPQSNRPAEVFVTCDDSGSTLDGFADAFATELSLLWQHGMSFEDTFRKFAFADFAPRGMTRNDEVRSARSIVDYVMQVVKRETEKRGGGGKRDEGRGARGEKRKSEDEDEDEDEKRVGRE